MTPSINPSGDEKKPYLYEIVCWVRDHGEIQADSRLRVRTLPLTVREGIAFAQIGPTTQCSPQLLNAMLREAALVVGKAHPAATRVERPTPTTMDMSSDRERP